MSFTTGHNNVNFIRDGHGDLLIWYQCLKDLLYISMLFEEMKDGELEVEGQSMFVHQPLLSGTRSSDAVSMVKCPF